MTDNVGCMVHSVVRGALQNLGVPEHLAWVVAATFLHFASFYYLLATLPLYIQDLGGSIFQVGLIIGVFSVSSLATRPLFGAWMDRAGRKRFLLAGAAIYVVASLGYLVIPSVPGLLVWRVFHAMGLATFSTAAASLSGDLAPPERRGTTMGIFGLAQPAALSVGPAVGAAVLAASSYPLLFLFTSFTALLALACVLPIPEGKTPKPAGPVTVATWRLPGVLPSVAVSATLQFAASIAYGTFVSFVAVVARERGLAVVGASFTLLALSSLGIRLVAGRLYDSWGPRAILPPALISLAIGMALLGVTANAPGFLLASVLAGAGIGGTHTTLLARVVERCPAEHRGSAVALFISCWELGVGGGTILMGRLAEAVGFRGMYLVAAALCLCGLGGLRTIARMPGLPPRDMAETKEP